MKTKTLKLSGRFAATDRANMAALDTSNPTDACGNEIKPGDPDYAEATAGKVETIEIKMGWSDCLVPLLVVYAEGSPKGRADALGELRRMATLADRHVADNPPAEWFQCLDWHPEPGPVGAAAGRWLFIAHGARYSRAEALALVERYAERGVKVRLLPC